MHPISTTIRKDGTIQCRHNDVRCCASSAGKQLWTPPGPRGRVAITNNGTPNSGKSMALPCHGVHPKPMELFSVVRPCHWRHMIQGSKLTGGVRLSNNAMVCCRAQLRPQDDPTDVPGAERHIDIVIVGAGPAGLAAALALQKIGCTDIVVVEQSDEEDAKMGGTALGLWTNAWKALDALGVGDAVRERASVVVDRVEICREDERKLREFSIKDCTGGPHEFRGVTRRALLEGMCTEIHPSTRVEYGKRLKSCTALHDSSVLLKMESGEEMRCNMVVGADGVRSVTSTGISPRFQDDLNYVGQIAIRGVAQYGSVPCDSIRQIWGPKTRAGVYPVSASELYWFVSFDGTGEGKRIYDGGQVLDLAKDVLRQSSPRWRNNLVWEAIEKTAPHCVTKSRLADRWDLGSLFPPMNNNEKVPIALVGDALHPMTPNLGQGGCTALEDGVILARMLARTGVTNVGNLKDKRTAISEAITQYIRERAKRCVPLTVRSHVMGALLQSNMYPVVFARDTIVSTIFDPSHFLDHANFDCGSL